MSFTRSSLETVAVRFALVATGLLAGVINARWLGVDGIGILVLLLLIRAVAFRFGSLGFGAAFAFFIARDRLRGTAVLGLALGTGLVASLASSAVVLSTWRLPFSPWVDLDANMLYLALPTIPLMFLTGYLKRLLSGELRIREMNSADLVSGLGNVGLLIALVIVLEAGLVGAVASTIISESLASSFLLWRLLKAPAAVAGEERGKEKRRPSLGEIWRYGRWNYLLMLANFLTEELPLLLLKTFAADNTPVGLMSRARVFSRQSGLVALPVAQVLFPFTAASEAKAAVHRTNVLCRNSLALSALVTGGVAPFIRPLLILLYGEEFGPAAEIFWALAPGAVVWPTGHFLAVHIAASGRPRAAFLAGFAAAIAAVAVCGLLIPRYGAVGAGLSASAIFSFRACLLLVVYGRVSGGSLLDSIVPRRSDWSYYRNVVGLLSRSRLP